MRYIHFKITWIPLHCRKNSKRQRGKKKRDLIECQKGCKTTFTLLTIFTSHSAGGNI